MAGRFGAILSSLSLAAGQSVRRNAGDSAFEAYTPFNSASDTLPYTQVNNLATARLVGRTTAGTGALEAISIGSGLSLSAGTLSATGGGLSVGSAVSGGGANRVLYEDGSQNLAASANLTFDGSVLNTGAKAFQTDLVLINGGDRSAALGYTVRITTDHASRTPLQLVGVSGQSNPLLAIYDNLGTLNGRWDSTGNISVNALTVAGDIGTSSGNSILLGDTNAAANGFYAFFKSGNTARTAVVMRAITSQTNPILDIQNSAGVPLMQFFPDGMFRVGYDGSNYCNFTVGSTGAVTFDAVGSGAKFTFSDDLEIADAKNLVLNSTTGTKIGTATSQKLAFYNASPIVQVTTGVTGATFTANSGTAVNDASTFDGYTIGQLVKALRNYGLLA
jgi:hypothetical protein